MIGGRRPTPGPQAGRPAGPGRAAPRALLPVHGQGPADREGGGQRADDARRQGSGRRCAASSSAAPRQRGRARRAAVEEEGPRDLQLGRDQLVGVRDRGDPARPDPRRRGRPGVRRSRSASRSRSSSSRWRSATARSASPTRRAAARTPSRAGTSGGTVSLIAASALLIDYVMTVAVSTSSAVEQVTSAFPALHDERVLIGVVAIGLITDRQPARPARGGQHLRRSRPTCSSARRC